MVCKCSATSECCLSDEMKKPNVDLTVEDDVLVASYLDAAIAHGAASDRGDYRNANRQHDIGVAILAELRKRNAQRRLLPLLRHDNPWVRCWSATVALEFAPSEAVDVLEAVVNERPSPPLTLDARLILQEWRKGNLKFE